MPMRSFRELPVLASRHSPAHQNHTTPLFCRWVMVGSFMEGSFRPDLCRPMENIEPGVTKPTFREPSAVLPQETWRAVLLETAIEVFSMMVGGATVTSPKDTDLSVLAEVTGMVGIAGAVRALFSLRCSSRSSTRMASQMLGVPHDQAVKLQGDAVGEICNMVAGYFKAKIGLGEKCMLSLPTVLMGHDYQ